jgi:hypothetical protein
LLQELNTIGRLHRLDPDFHADALCDVSREMGLNSGDLARLVPEPIGRVISFCAGNKLTFGLDVSERVCSCCRSQKT